MAAPCAEPWTVENTQDWMDKTPTSTYNLSVWSSSSLGRWHPRSSVLLVLTRHSSLILNEQWTRVINLSMFFLLCYDLTTILRSRALHQVLSSAIQYAWRSYMLSRLYRKVKSFRSNLLAKIDQNDRNRSKWVGELSKWLARRRNRNALSTDTKKIDGLQVCAILFFHLHYSTISP
jgi:hypothetical protein